MIVVKYANNYNFHAIHALKKVVVGIGDYKVASNPHVLATYSLGSCVAVILYAPVKRIGALIHAMLPRPKTPNPDNPAKYVETAIPMVLGRLRIKGVDTKELEAAIIGGANILKTTGALAIGKRNVEAAKRILNMYRIKVVAEDTGGTRSRSVVFNLGNGELYVITPRHKLF